MEKHPVYDALAIVSDADKIMLVKLDYLGIGGVPR